MKRRAHIEFLSFDKIRVTNAYHQKDFDLHGLKKKDVLIDLVTLKSVEKSNFYMFVQRGDGTLASPYGLSVYAKVDSSGSESDLTRGPNFDWPEFNAKNFKEQTFEVTIPD